MPDIDDVRTFIRTALSTNSLVTLGYAKKYVESQR
jgi:hypothetical protein